jgi:4-hydroxy-tetrahydrodipicolinate reductase
MIKLILHGCNGKMGRAVVSAVEEDKDIEIVAGVDRFPESLNNSFPVYDDLSRVKERADVLLDFSIPNALPSLLEYVRKTSVALVIATTGYSPEDLEAIEKQSEKTAIFRAANMSIGINLMYELIQKAASVFGDNFDIEIIEKHHNQKIDAPSGTALALADAVNEVFLNSKHYTYGRHSKTDRRSKNEIGIHAIRGGTIAGEHTVHFAGQDEILEITHIAQSRRIFALGALTAVKFMAGKKNGLYTMADALLAQSAVTNIYTDNEQGMISVNYLPNKPDILSELFHSLSEKGIIIDMISQTAPIQEKINLSFTLPAASLETAVKLVKNFENRYPDIQTQVYEAITQVAVEGLGMERQSGIAARIFQALASQNISIKLITTSETKVSMVIDRQEEKSAVEAIMKAFNL